MFNISFVSGRNWFYSIISLQLSELSVEIKDDLFCYFRFLYHEHLKTDKSVKDTDHHPLILTVKFGKSWFGDTEFLRIYDIHG